MSYKHTSLFWPKTLRSMLQRTYVRENTIIQLTIYRLYRITKVCDYVVANVLVSLHIDFKIFKHLKIFG